MQSLTRESPAKVNLYLRVGAVRPDGFHELVTVFHRIDLCDEITFRKSPRLALRCSHPDVPCDERNLIVKAVRLLEERTGRDLPVEVSLKKNAPVAGGVGGASGNAAVTLTALNELFELGLSRQTLYEMGCRIGSDVPFFLADTPFALGTGRGDVLSPVKTDIKLAFLLCCAPIPILSKQVYYQYDTWAKLGLTPPTPDVTMLLALLQEKRGDAVSEFLYNSLEEAILPNYPIVRQIKEFLRAGRYGYGTLVSGSGPALFTLITAKEEGVTLRERFLREAPAGIRDCRVVVTGTFV